MNEDAAALLAKLARVRITCRIALGLVWLYEGVVPKLLFPRAGQTELVRQSGLSFGAPEVTLQVMGIAQALVGIWLLSGIAERAAAAFATAWMCVLIILVASGKPDMLTDPFGALAKDMCLVACAYAVWALSPLNSAGHA
ncbi:MAG TPA: DoxX-like family protein [Chthoniobacterales bacterium]|nr:DoxX-like family protein [Chthoniobacterales bacterium]